MDRLFGEWFLPLRVMGFFLILAITATLYALYSRVASGPVACISAVFGMMLLQSGVTHVTYDYLQFAMFYGLLTALMLVKACESEGFADKVRTGWRPGPGSSWRAPRRASAS